MGSSTSEQDVHRPIVEVHKNAGASGQSYVDEVRHFPMIAIGVIGIVAYHWYLLHSYWGRVQY